MLKSGGAGLSPEKRTDMEGRVNILTTFIRASLDNRYEWKDHDAKLEGSADAPPPPPPASEEEGKGEEEEVSLDDEEDKDL